MEISRSPLSHIVLVGTSTIRNAAFRPGMLQSMGLSDDEVNEIVGILKECNANSNMCTGESVSRALQAVSRLTLTHPYEMSAELNGMRPWLEAFKHGNSRAVGRVILLETDTVSGNAAGRVLEDVFSGYAISVERITVAKLGVPGYFVEGIKNLKSSITRVAERLSREGYCSLINLTGGFKPESAIGLVASIGYIPLGYYIHETFKDVVYIPLYPLANPSSVRETLKKALDRREWAGFRDQPEWLKYLACTLAPIGKAKVRREELLLSYDIIDIIKALIG